MHQLSSEQTMHQVVDLFKWGGDMTRIHILFLLAQRELCVTEIPQAVDISQSVISYQLRVLKQMDLIKFRREGKNMLYSLADDHDLAIWQTGL